jgi:hypothetical protein
VRATEEYQDPAITYLHRPHCPRMSDDLRRGETGQRAEREFRGRYTQTVGRGAPAAAEHHGDVMGRYPGALGEYRGSLACHPRRINHAQ